MIKYRHFFFPEEGIIIWQAAISITSYSLSYLSSRSSRNLAESLRIYKSRQKGRRQKPKGKKKKTKQKEHKNAIFTLPV